MNLAGIATLVVGLVVYANIWSAATGASGGGITGLGLLLVIVITFALMAIHGLVIARFGGTPRYGATMVEKVLPALSCTSPGSLLTRRQFVLIGLAPAMVRVPATALSVALLPHVGWLVVPAAMHLGGCIGDFTMTFIVARLAPGSLVEDLKSDMRLYQPEGATAPAAT
jgi:hypothetical protein